MLSEEHIRSILTWSDIAAQETGLTRAEQTLVSTLRFALELCPRCQYSTQSTWHTMLCGYAYKK